jgi:hypothetical protein
MHVRNGQLDQQFSDDYREAWRSTPEMVLSSALMTKSTPLLPSNRLDTFPDSKVEYLRVHYELCRYEATEPLREAVAEFREDRRMMEGERSKGYIYTQVCVFLLFPDFISPDIINPAEFSFHYRPCKKYLS